GDMREAERLLREAIAHYKDTLPPNHLNVAISRMKLGHALARQGRFPEAETELLASRDILAKLSTPPESWGQRTNSELAELYDAWKRPDKAAAIRAEMKPGS